MSKKLAFFFVAVSFILIVVYSYGLIIKDSSRNVLNEIDQQVVSPENEGVDEVSNSFVHETIDDNITPEEKEKKINEILSKLEDMKTDQLILVNKWNSLSENYKPASLIDSVGAIPSTKSEMFLQEDAYKSALELYKAAVADGLTGLRIVSGYRPYSYQQGLYNAQINKFSAQYDLETAKQKAGEIVAIPGTSEHQTGMAIDFSDLELISTGDPLNEDFKNTPEGQWLRNNSWKYGFILRYSPEKKDITGIISEPWHFRYVGIPHGEYITKNNLCFEEYIDIIKRDTKIIFEDYFGNKYQITYIHKENHDILLDDLFNIEEIVNVSEIGEDQYIITQKISE